MLLGWGTTFRELRVLSKMFYDGEVKISNQSYKKVDILDDLQLLNIIEKTKIFFDGLRGSFQYQL